VAIFLGAWLIVSGTIAISGAFAARRLLPDWWLLLLFGLLEVPLGVLALANPGATLAAIITVAGIWAVAIGVMRVVLAFELKRLPDDVDEAFALGNPDEAARKAEPTPADARSSMTARGHCVPRRARVIVGGGRKTWPARLTRLRRTGPEPLPPVAIGRALAGPRTPTKRDLFILSSPPHLSSARRSTAGSTRPGGTARPSTRVTRTSPRGWPARPAIR
jgi:hypothetical protein